MKTEVQQLSPAPKFVPFRLVLDIETENVARILGALYGINGAMAERLKEQGYGLGEIGIGEISALFRAIGLPADTALVAVGIYRTEEGK